MDMLPLWGDTSIHGHESPLIKYSQTDQPRRASKSINALPFGVRWLQLSDSELLI